MFSMHFIWWNMVMKIFVIDAQVLNLGFSSVCKSVNRDTYGLHTPVFMVDLKKIGLWNCVFRLMSCKYWSTYQCFKGLENYFESSCYNKTSKYDSGTAEDLGSAILTRVVSPNDGALHKVFPKLSQTYSTSRYYSLSRNKNTDTVDQKLSYGSYRMSNYDSHSYETSRN